MNDTFAALQGEYSTLLGAMVINADQETELTARAKVILARANAEDFASVIAATGVPKLWAIASFERESSSDYADSPAQGDPWNRVSVNVPRGIGPYSSWAQAAIAAYRIDHLDQVGAGNWTWARACYEGELFNGFGPRDHGKHTGYLWSWSNIYSGGKYIADDDWSASAIDQQCGMVPMMAALLRLDPSLALADVLPIGASSSMFPAAPAPAPAGLDGGAIGVKALQAKLNALGAHLTVDGNYGRMTANAVRSCQAAFHLPITGIADAATIAAIMGAS